MLKIGEFSKVVRLTVKTLRLYDEMGLLKPKEVDEWSGYRFYDTDQLPLAQKIISLKQAGFSLAEIAGLIQDRVNPKDFIQKLESKSQDIEKEITKDQEKIKQIKAYVETLRKEGNMDYHVFIKDLPEVTVASRRLVIKDYNELFRVAPEMGEMMKAQNLKCLTPAYCFNIYHDGEYKEKDIDVEICEAVVTPGKDTEELKFKKLAKANAACVLHKGPYEKLGQAYGALLNWLKENDYEAADLFRESYIDGIWNRENPEEWLTEIQVPIKKK